MRNTVMSRRWPVLGGGLVLVLILAGCGGEAQPPGPPVPAPSGEPGIRQPAPQVNCTEEVDDAAGMERVLASASPGDRICLSGDMGDARLEIERSGTAEEPIVILGGGRTTTAGITVEADHVVVDGVRAEDPEAPGIYLNGAHITVQNSASISPRGGDGDGIRFFGRDIKILHNLVRDTVGTDEKHADAIQTFATSEEYTASQNILIAGNRLEEIDNICLIAEGPNSSAGDGSGEGESKNLVFTNNYCENGAGQALYVDDFQDVTVTNNRIVGDITKAFSFNNGSTGATVFGNTVVSDVEYVVGIDDSSEDGYQGPEPGGGP